MSAHLTAQQIEHYRQRTLQPTELLSVDDHLAACKPCRQKLYAETQPQAVIASLRADLQRPEHLAYEQLAAYVDDELNDSDRELVAEHLDACAQCRTEMQDLADFKTTLVPLPENAPARPVAVTLRARVANFFRPFASPSAFQLAGVSAALIVIAAFAVWLALKATRPAQVAVNNQSQTPNIIAPTPNITATPTPNASPAVSPQQPTSVGAPEPTPLATAPPAPPSEIVVALNDGGGQVTLDRQGQLAGLESLTPAQQRAIKSALATQRVEPSTTIAGLTGHAGVLMGGASEGVSFALRAPVGTAVSTDRPVFSWRALAGAKSYVVTVYDAGYNKVLTSPPLNATVWNAPQTLRRGGLYSWQVTATTGDKEIASPAPPAPEARFGILSETQARELSRAEQAARTSHLARGVLYAQAGLLDDAEREFRALLAENPRSPVARKLLLNVQSLRRAK